MKKLVALLLAVVMVFGLVACSDTNTKTPTNGTEEQKNDKDYEIVVIAKNAESTWGIRQELGVKWFADETGIRSAPPLWMPLCSCSCWRMPLHRVWTRSASCQWMWNPLSPPWSAPGNKELL